VQIHNTLYLPSTPLNILVSCALAVYKQSLPDSNELAELWLIDQKNTTHNPYFEALKVWKDSPFQQVKVFSGAHQAKQKLAQRQQNFSAIRKGLASFQATQVAVGSDRRIEFQYVMHLLQENSPPAKGLYLDDGLYSYMGRPYHAVKDGLNALIKKLIYGFWWEEPKTVGASSWIDQAWLFAPQQAVTLLQAKETAILEPHWFQNSSIEGLSQAVARQLDYDISSLAALEVMLLIPHPNNIKKMPGYEKRIQQIVATLHQQGKKVGVKYHPRSPLEDALQLKEYGASEIVPSPLAFEFCLPMFSKDCLVIGDVGTALLTCKWLRPDLAVFAVLDAQDAFQKRFISMSHAMNINVTNQIEDVFI
jgi:hypothetical protein